MNSQDKKCVMVLDENLPIGLLSNTAAIMGITLGKYIPQAIGPEVLDRTGNPHLGIIQFPVPILKANKEKIRAIREQLFEPAFSQLIVVDFSDVAQSCNVYEEYIKKAAATEENEFTYLGIGICGSKKLVNTLTGNLPLLR